MKMCNIYHFFFFFFCPLRQSKIFFELERTCAAELAALAETQTVQCEYTMMDIEKHISLCEQYSSSDDVIQGVIDNTNIGRFLVVFFVLRLLLFVFCNILMCFAAQNILCLLRTPLLLAYMSSFVCFHAIQNCASVYPSTCRYKPSPTESTS